MFWWASIIFGAGVLALLYVFYVVDTTFEIPVEWKQRLEAKCSTSISFFSFTNASLIEGGTVGMVIGGYFSLLSFYQSPYIL
jgi:hypothetical protein